MLMLNKAVLGDFALFENFVILVDQIELDRTKQFGEGGVVDTHLGCM